LYIAGNIRADKLIDEYKKVHPNDQSPLPSPASVESRASREQWRKEKDEFAKKVKAVKEESLVKLFAENGLSRDERVKLLVEGATKPDKVLFEGPAGQQMATVAPDYEIRLKYQKEINALLGEYAPVKKDITSDGKAICGPGGAELAAIEGGIQGMKIALAQCLQRLQVVPSSSTMSEFCPEAIEAEYSVIGQTGPETA
jgi:hypothetical protein